MIDPDDDRLLRKIDPLNSALVILCLLGGGACFALAAYRTTFSGWLTPTTCGVVLWLLGWHLKQLGRLY